MASDNINAWDRLVKAREKKADGGNAAQEAPVVKNDGDAWEKLRKAKEKQAQKAAMAQYEESWQKDIAAANQKYDDLDGIYQRASNVRAFASPEARDNYLASLGYEGITGLEGALADAKATTDFYKSYPTYEGYLDYVALQSKTESLKRSYTEEAGREAWNEYQKEVEKKKAEDAEYEKQFYASGGQTTVGGLYRPVESDRQNTINAKNEPQDDWTDEEKFTFAYIKKGGGDYEAYARALNREKAGEAKAQETKEAVDFATDGFWNGVATTLESIGLGGTYGFGEFMNAVVYGADTTDYNRYLTPFERNQAQVSAISEKLNEAGGTIDESVPVFGGKGWGDAYQLLNSILQSAAFGKFGQISGSQLATFVNFFGQAAASGINEAKAKGATNEQALAYGTLAGFFEGFFEEFSIDKVMQVCKSPVGMRAVLKNVLQSAGIEASEEMFTTTANKIAEAAILAEKSDLGSKSLLENIEDILFDGVGGALSGGVHAGALSAVNYITTNSATGKNIKAGGNVEALEALARENGTLKEGRKMPTSDIGVGALSAKTEQSMLENFGRNVGLDKSAIKTLVYGYESGSGVPEYAEAFLEYYNAGRQGAEMPSGDGGMLDKDIRRAAYNEGRIKALEERITQQSVVQSSAEQTKATAQTAERMQTAEQTVTNEQIDTPIEEKAEGAQNVASEAAAAPRAAGMTWAYGKSGREVYSSAEAGGVSAAVYDKVMTRVYADAYGGKSDTEIYKAARAIAGDKISDGDIGDMIDAAISDRAEKKNRKVVRREGKVNFTGANISADEKRAISALARYAQVDIDFADLGDANGRYESAHITIDINADKPLAAVLGHEAYHRFFEAAPEAARTVEKLAYAAATEKDADIVRKTLEKYMDAGKPISIGDAVEEIAADYMGDIVSKPERVEALIKLANSKKKKSALGRFIDWVRERWNNFKRRFDGSVSDADVRATDEALDAIAEMMRRASVELEGAPMVTEMTVFGEEIKVRNDSESENAESVAEEEPEIAVENEEPKVRETAGELVAEEETEPAAEESGETEVGEAAESAVESAESAEKTETPAENEKTDPKKRVKTAKPLRKVSVEKIVKNFADEAAKGKTQYPAVRMPAHDDYWVGDSFSLVKVSKAVYDDYVIGKTFSTENYPKMKLQSVRDVSRDHAERLLENCISNDGSYVRATKAKRAKLGKMTVVGLEGENGVTYIDYKHLKRFVGYEIHFDPGTLRAVQFYDGDEIIGFALPLKHNATENEQWQDLDLKTLKAVEAEGGAKYSLKDITKDDVRSIREIAAAHGGRRVSINDFTSEDVKKAEPWARKFYEELGIKSPFFRAWFGDWRAYDASKVKIVKNVGESFSAGKEVNTDTGKSISWGHTLKSETLTHAAKEKISVSAINDISEIVKNAVFMDTVTSDNSSKTKMSGSAFMHSFYTLYDNGSTVNLLKLYVEEAFSKTGVFTRAYELKDIKKVADVPNSVHSESRGLTDETPSTTYSISDLFELVKTYDKEFHPKEVNSALLNDDGTPKVVYHGTDAEFNTFSSRNGVYFFSESYDYAEAMAEERKGSRIIRAYLKMENPMREKLSPGQFTDPSYERPFIEKAKKNGYDGVIIENDTDDELAKDIFYVVFHPTQIKSATDNIGTFDGGNPDIRFSLKEKTPSARVAELEKELDKIKNGGVRTGGTVPSPTKMKKLVDGLFTDYNGKTTKKSMTEALSDVYAQMTKFVKMQNGAAKDAAWSKISEKLGEIAADVCNGKLDSETAEVSERYNLYSEAMNRAVLAQKVEIMCELFEMPNNITAADRIATLETEKKDALREVREQRAKTVKALKLAETTDAEIDRKYYESEARKKLLHIARRLQNIKQVNSQKLIDDIVKSAVDCISSLKELDTVSLGMRTSTKEYLENLSAWYSEQKKNSDFYGDDRTENELARLSKMKISEMSIKDVEALTEALMSVENTIRTQNKLIDSEDKRNFQEQGSELIYDVEQTAGARKGLYDNIVTESLSPIRAVERMIGYKDSDPLMMRVRELNDGQRRMLKWITDSERTFDRWTRDSEYMKKLSGKNADIIMTTAGGGIMTRGMLISLYLHSFNRQNMAHIDRGGVVLPDGKLYKAGNIADAYAKKSIVRMSRSQILQLAGEKLTEKDHAFAVALKQYFNVTAKDGINDVSNKVLGYDLAKVGEYFPISVNGAFTKAEYEQIKCDGSVEGIGNLKERTDSGLPIDLVDVTSVLHRAVELNAKYIGLAIPVRNISKLLRITKVRSGTDAAGNVVLEKMLSGDGFEHYIYDTSVMDAIERKWGKNGADYLKKMLADVQGLNVKEKNTFTDMFNALRSNYAQATLTLNPAVAFKQTASYPTAAAVIGWKALAKGLNPARRVNLDVVSKYTPLLAYRSLGYTDADLGAIVQRRGRLPVWLNWIQTMDVLTTKRLWAACEYYVSDNNKSLAVRSDEWYKAVADVYNRVIEETQPNYTAMQRPQMLRSSDTLLRNIAMFKTQPMQNLNLIYDAVGNWRAKKSMMTQNPTAENRAALKEAGARLGRTVASQVVQAAMMAAITLAWNAARGKLKRYTGDDEEEGVFQGRGYARFLIDVVENLAAGIPGATELASITEGIVGIFTDGRFQYYGIEAATPAMISDALDSVGKAIEQLNKIAAGDADAEKVIKCAETLGDAIGKMFGIPIGNVDKVMRIFLRILGAE